jgi:hypothetical protein
MDIGLAEVLRVYPSRIIQRAERGSEILGSCELCALCGSTHVTHKYIHVSYISLDNWIIGYIEDLTH